MARSQLELLVLYQDINLMLQEAEEEKMKMGFQMGGIEKLKRGETSSQVRLSQDS